MSDLPRATLPATPEAIALALTDLLQSDGWALVTQMVLEQYGPSAFEAAVDGAMGELRPGDDERAVITQIRAAFKAARGVLDMPDMKLRQAKGAPKAAAAVADRFARFRRTSVKPERAAW